MYHKNMNIKYLLIAITFLAPLASAEITEKKWLNDMFEGCNNEPSDWLTTGQSFEYCGCFVNKISQDLNAADLVKLGAEYMLDEDDLTPFLKNEKIVDAAAECVMKVLE